MESKRTKKIYKYQNRFRLTYTENRLVAAREDGVRGEAK